jgi:CPA1 family monovalent cation:H+ antiporter
MDSAYPKFPLPLAQICCGVIIALTPFNTKITIDPELFMGVLIAPLLFRESEEADIVALWRIRKTVLFMVFGLVFVTVFVIGFSIHSLVPTIPLAACFCLGAALGPTDAIAVSTVSSRVEISDKIMNILKGEFLINDASGVISFNFAALALVTGSFSLFDASKEFIILCAGGLAAGFVIASVKTYSLSFLRRASIHNSAAFMLIEILTPVLCFFVAERLGFSGILAAVTAGSRQAFSVRKIEKFEAEFTTLKKSVWDMITMVFNSFIFILLGLSLPSIIEVVVLLDDYTLGFAMAVGLFATVALFAVRFIGVFIAARGMKEKEPKERLRNLTILTLSGVKGTVSLATAFSLPLTLHGGEAFAHRNFLLLVVACVIVFSLVISTVFLPIIAKKKRPRRRSNIYARIIREVVSDVEASDSVCAKAIAINLRQRARQLEYEELEDEEKKTAELIRREFSKREFALLKKQRKNGEITATEYAECRRILAILSVMHEGSLLRRFFNRLRFTFRLMGDPEPDAGEIEVTGESDGANGRGGSGKRGEDGAAGGGEPDGHRIQELFWSNTGSVGTVLERRYSGGDKHVLTRVIERRIDLTTSIMQRYYGELAGREFIEEYDREIKRCFALERQKLDEYAAEGRVDEDEADEIRVQINTLENYAISNIQSDASLRLVMMKRASRHFSPHRKK